MLEIKNEIGFRMCADGVLILNGEGRYVGFLLSKVHSLDVQG